jgi:hypothetical protein
MTPPAPNSLARHLRVPGYLFFGIAMILPLLDLLVSVYPIRLGTVVWRFGAVGFLSGAIGAPLLILFFIFALALFAGDRKVIMTVGVVAALIALLLVAGTGSFALDALQMKRRIQAAAQQRFVMVAMQAMLKIILQAISAIVLSITAFRTLKNWKRVTNTRTESRGSGSLMMGRPSSPRSVTAAAEAPPAEVAATPEE